MSASAPAAPREVDDAVARRAADFFQRRRFWEWSEADQAELDAWLAESVLHEVAYLRVEGIAAYADEVVAARSCESEASRQGRGHKAPWHFMLPLLAMAAVALLAMFAMPLVRTMLVPPDRTYSTDVGGRTLLAFSDRTEIELNTDTAIRYRMTTAERTVWLEKGEAWFHVAHDAAHPFTVVIGKDRVTDLGTEFVVRRGAGGVEVALLAGRAALATQGAQTATLRPGDVAVATTGSLSVARKSPRELADELAWRRGMLVFRNAKLADVVREFNRYNTTRLVIADPSIAGVKISAALRTDDYEAFLNLVHAMLDLRVDRAGNDILISREPAKAKRMKAASAL